MWFTHVSQCLEQCLAHRRSTRGVESRETGNSVWLVWELLWGRRGRSALGWDQCPRLPSVGQSQ